MTQATMDYIKQFNMSNCTSPESENNNWFTTFEYFRFNEDGSFTCKRGPDFSYDEEGLIWDLINESSMDFTIAGEDGCISNFDMYTPLFNPMTGLLYCVPYSTQEKYKEMQEVTVYGREVTPEELQEIYNFIGDGEVEEEAQEETEKIPSIGNLLWDLLLNHKGHNVSIVTYGDPDDPTDVCLECEDCGEVILDAELYDLCGK